LRWKTRAVSEQGRALRSRLYTSGAPWEVARLLAELAALREPVLLPDILPFLRVDVPEVARAAAQAARQLLMAVPGTDLPWLDERLRSSSIYNRAFPQVWYGLRPEGLDPFEREGETGFSLLAIAGSHHSGYVREEAVRRLARIQDGRELPFLLVRLNDWVSQVAQAAQASLSDRLHSGYAPHLAANLPLVLRLRDETRRRPAIELVEAVAALLLRPENRGVLAEGLAPDRERDIRRACASLLFSPATTPRSEEIERGVDDRDPVIRLRAARRLLALAPGEEKARLLAQIRHDPFMPVRREALEESVRSRPESAVAEMESALFDPHAAIRHTARLFLAREGDRDFAETYRQALSRTAGKSLVATLAGLGETGSKTDTTLVLPFLDHPLGRVRAAAVRALGKLDARGFLPRLVEILQTDAGKPAREAMLILRENVFFMPAERIWAALTTAESARAKRSFLWLVASFSKWESLPYLLAASTWADEEIAQDARFQLDRWFYRFNRSFTKPSADQLQRIRIATRQAGHRLPPKTLRSLEFLIEKGW
jgi:HEAT repeat protein